MSRGIGNPWKGGNKSVCSLNNNLEFEVRRHANEREFLIPLSFHHSNIVFA